MELKATILDHFKMLFSLILITFIGLVIIASSKLGNSTFLWTISIIYFMVFFIPTLYIHYNYSTRSNNIIYKIDSTGIIKIENGKTVFFKNSEIEKIVIYATAKKLKNSGYTNFTFEDYFYAEIKLYENPPLIITSLFSTKIDEILFENFKDKTITKIKTFYPTIKKHYC